MKKSELKIQAERLANAYEKNNKVWANIHLLYAALKSESPPPEWTILESIKAASETIGDVGLDLAEFLDSYNFGDKK
jgi:hypothetical protein